MNAAVGMPCPVCKVPLVMSDRQGVEIDYCPQCRGIWLDRGELDKIIERGIGVQKQLSNRDVDLGHRNMLGHVADEFTCSLH
mgnify:CR=1 FL=1